MSTDTLLNPEQIAARLQVSEYTALKWLRQGRIKGRKLGKFWRVRESDLEAFINEPPTLRLVETPATPAPSTNGTTAVPTPAAVETHEARKAALLARLQALQAAGMSTQAIATQLNREGVPTLSGRGQWQKGTISTLLAQAEGTR
jgi:excisionase family DNA binding protein